MFWVLPLVLLVTPDSTGHPQQTIEDMLRGYVVHTIIFKQTLQTIGLHIICNSIYTFRNIISITHIYIFTDP